MNKLRDFGISIERLVKVWKSKLENGEEELLADDLRWFVEIFDRFFEEKNINEFININGRYVDVDLFEGFDLESYFEQLSFSNEELGIVRPKYYERSKDEVNREINVSINKEIYYNVFEVYLNALKRVAGFANNSSLRITQIRLRIVLRKIFFKVMTFESKGFKSEALLKDFLNESVYGALSIDELKDSFPSKEFVCLVYFQIVFEIYKDDFIDANKALIIRSYLLSSWLKLNSSGKNEFLREFLQSLSQMTISDIRIKEIDLFTLSRLIPGGRLDHPFISQLRILEEERKKIITEEDLKGFSELFSNCLTFPLPDGIEEDDRLYFIKTENDHANELFKFREIQLLVIEILGLTYHFQGLEGLIEAFRILRKNEEFSNQKSFFPNSEFEILAWLVLTRNLKVNISGRFYGSFAYRHLDYLLSYIVVNTFHKKFEIDRLKSVLSSYGLSGDSGAMNSLKEFVKSILERLHENPLINKEEIKRIRSIWKKIITCFESSLVDAEKEILIPEDVFIRFKDEVIRGYKEKSLIFRISELSTGVQDRTPSENSFQITVGRNELILRKYFIPNWFIPLYGLSDNVSLDIAEQESIQFEIKLFHELDVSISKSLKRNEVLVELLKISVPSFVLFKNSFPDYWITEAQKGGEKVFDDATHSVLRYNTFDKDPEIIIVPKKAIEIDGIVDSTLADFEPLDSKVYWKLLDLSNDGDSRELVRSRPPYFLRDSSDLEEELKKYLWLRVFTKYTISIDPNQVLRFKLNPYGE